MENQAFMSNLNENKKTTSRPIEAVLDSNLQDQQEKQSETIEKEKNYNENIERFEPDIDNYLETEITQNLPEDYKEKYAEILNNHFSELDKNPISPNCKFTLVLPAFGEEKVILKTLESLQQQEGVLPDNFEVIVVNNYQEGKKPHVNDYDGAGKKIGEHEDKTTELVKEFAKNAKLKVQVVEQAFPEQIKGVGIASKLGMDSALKRQEKSPQIIGYYGADTIFDKNWVKGVLDGFQEKKVDGDK